MKAKEISIHKSLHEIHGQSSSVFSITTTYLSGIISLISILIIYSQSSLVYEWWRLLLLGIVSADIGAGAVANFTKGTNSYYSGEQKRKTRIIFIFTHVAHAAAFLLAINYFSIKAGLMMAYIVGGTFLINSIKKQEEQKVVAALLMVLGISILLIVQISNPLLAWFFPLFMLKLFIAFGIRRY